MAFHPCGAYLFLMTITAVLSFIAGAFWSGPLHDLLGTGEIKGEIKGRTTHSFRDPILNVSITESNSISITEDFLLLRIGRPWFSSARGGGEASAQRLFDAHHIPLLAAWPAGVGGLANLLGLLFILGGEEPGCPVVYQTCGRKSDAVRRPRYNSRAQRALGTSPLPKARRTLCFSRDSLAPSPWAML